MSTDNENYGFLETHYYFADNSHSMSAFVKNKCDKALLTIIEEASKELAIDRDLKVEVLPLSEGGLVEWYKFLTTPEGTNFLGLFIAVLTLIYTVKPPLPSESELDIENKELEKEKKKLEIRLLKKQVEDIENKDQNLEEVKEVEESIKEVVYDLLINNFRIRKNLSVFYKSLIEYDKVEAIGFGTYDKNYKVIIPEKKVDRSEFKGFLLDSNEIKEIDENAKILIYSPNLDKGKRKWRGLYEKEDKVIAFSMKDNDFKSDVESGVVTFKNGSMIRAVLTTTIKIDMTGAESSRSYCVENVLNYSHDKGYTETSQGKKYKANKKDAEAQISISFDD